MEEGKDNPIEAIRHFFTQLNHLFLTLNIINKCFRLRTVEEYTNNFHIQLEHHQVDPGQEVRAGSRRKTPEIDGTWKQYSGKQIRWPDSFGSAWNKQEPGKTGSRIRSSDSCVEFLTFSGGFRPETVRFLRVSAGKFTEYCVRNYCPGEFIDDALEKNDLIKKDNEVNLFQIKKINKHDIFLLERTTDT
jgi:hypothetical protein